MYGYATPYYLPAPAAFGGTSPVYVVFIIGMLLFMASNTMPALLPSPERIGNVAPFILQWGFLLIILALMAHMTGLAAGVPRLHLTYVHLTVAFLLFFIIWNHVVSELPPQEEAPKASSSSSSSSSKREERKEEKKEKKADPPAPSSWDDLRAHPSAFLTTRLNRLVPWPFPMGRAAPKGPELWWESAVPAHVSVRGHFNRPAVVDPSTGKEESRSKEKTDDKEKERQKERLKAKEEDKTKEAAKVKEKERENEREREKAKLLKAKEAEKVKAAAAAATSKSSSSTLSASRTPAAASATEPSAAAPVVNDDARAKQRLWRTKALVMIVGIGLINKTLGFFLLLAFSLQLVSQEVDGPRPAPASVPAPVPSSTSTSSRPSGSSSSSSRRSTSSSSSSSSSAQISRSEEEQEKLAKKKALGEKEKTKDEAEKAKAKEKDRAKEKEKSSSSSTSSSRPSPSSSVSKGSSSSSKEKPITSAAIREAAGTKTETPLADSHGGVPYSLGFEMHYIHSAPDGKLDTSSSAIPSEGMAHPLMTTTWKGYAN